MTKAYEVTDAQFTGAQDVAGAPITGVPFEINENFTGAQETDNTVRVKEARSRLSLSLKKSKAPENFSHSKILKKSSDIEFVDSIIIESSDSSPDSDNDVEYYEPDDNPGTDQHNTFLYQ